jgi:hypothetical protein
MLRCLMRVEEEFVEIIAGLRSIAAMFRHATRLVPDTGRIELSSRFRG